MHQLSQVKASDRRSKKRDKVMLVLQTFSGTSILIALIAMLLIFRAQPVSFSPLDANLGIRTTWDGTLINYLAFVMAMGIVVGAAGLFANSKRLKRRYDFLRINLVVVPAVCIIGLVTYFLLI